MNIAVEANHPGTVVFSMACYSFCLWWVSFLSGGPSPVQASIQDPMDLAQGPRMNTQPVFPFIYMAFKKHRSLNL